MEEDGFDGAVGCVLRCGGRHQLGVALEEEVDLIQELVKVQGGEELRKLPSYLPDAL